MTPPTLAPPAEPTMLAVAIAKVDAVAAVIVHNVHSLVGGDTSVTLSYQEWHDALHDLHAARMALRTQQILTRRGTA